MNVGARNEPLLLKRLIALPTQTMARKLRELNDRKTSVRSKGLTLSVWSLQIMTIVIVLMILFVREVYLWFGAAAAAVAILSGLSIFAHVAGAALGTRLRAGKDLPDSDDATPKLIQPVEALDSDFAPQTRLSHQTPLDRKPIYVAVGMGAAFAALAASVILTLVMWDDLAIVNVLFGAFSAAVIGGLFGFWLSSLFQVLHGAVVEAQDDAPSRVSRQN